jgi:hypothetical protein
MPICDVIVMNAEDLQTAMNQENKAQIHKNIMELLAPLRKCCSTSEMCKKIKTNFFGNLGLMSKKLARNRRFLFKTVLFFANKYSITSIFKKNAQFFAQNCRNV